jgi:hypothetical protein
VASFGCDDVSIGGKCCASGLPHQRYEMTVTFSLNCNASAQGIFESNNARIAALFVEPMKIYSSAHRHFSIQAPKRIQNRAIFIRRRNGHSFISRITAWLKDTVMALLTRMLGSRA